MSFNRTAVEQMNYTSHQFRKTEYISLEQILYELNGNYLL